MQVNERDEQAWVLMGVKSRGKVVKITMAMAMGKWGDLG